jgi:hypothetical protein
VQAWPSDLSGALLQGISQAQIILLQREVPDRINVAVASAARYFYLIICFNKCWIVNIIPDMMNVGSSVPLECL